ncbi:MAG: DUF3488 domain-containing transglutaminase family protein [Magnetococcales bacterium]|nr:DUF3488 domain-containing transglutaminase family protein [Magnetococcales bacterium]
MLPHFWYLPPLLTTGGAAVSGWWLWHWHDTGRPWFPSLVTKTTLMLIGLVIIIQHHGPPLASEPAIAFLVTLAWIKLLEVRQTRDVEVMVLLGFFLLATSFFHSQSLPLALYAITITPLLVWTLILNSSPKLSLSTGGRRAGILLLQSLPLAGLMFLLLPRFSVPLWILPTRTEVAKTGLGPSMTPGSISRLIVSNRVAFRVKFLSPAPKPAQMYWRGPVLWQLSGETWRALDIPLPGPPPTSKPMGMRWVQEVTMEPSALPLLFALETPDDAPSAGRLNRDGQIMAINPNHAPRRYTVVSHAEHFSQEPPLKHERRLALSLPPSGNPRARALASGWHRNSTSAEEIVQAALNYFAVHSFTYSLTPPPLGKDAIDGFLFLSRRGFCEHFAGALTFLLRASGIMARVVTGYQGGTFNPLGDHLTVRDADAHAWVEAWLPQRGWVRLDPTSFIAPTRVEQGIHAVIDGQLDAFSLMPTTVTSLRLGRNAWDLIEYEWNRLVIGFNPDKQRAFWSTFGLVRPETWELLLVMMGSVMVFPFVWTLVARIRSAFATDDDPYRRLYAQFCRKLARAGVPRHPWEAPLTYGRRAATLLPGSSREIMLLATLCSRWRYEQSLSPGQIRLWKHKTRMFSPGHK